MNLSYNHTNLHFKPMQQRTFLLPHKSPFKTAEFRFYYKKRRRLKHPRKLVLVNSSLLPSSSFPFDSLNLQNLTSFDFLAPAALGLASGFALYLSSQLTKYDKNFNEQVSEIVGEWVLFTSSTPFNRFVFLRCPSVSFEGSDLIEDVNERLVKEDRHFVRLDSGRIQATNNVEDGDATVESGRLEYQRVCVSAEDGGVVSLDWPANLDLKEERGLDTTLLLVPGTPEGSMDRSVRSFVCEALKRGLFPVVMNPRGCAGSPLTTARLFTAADSDDICTAVQFISKARPWTTLMGVGWGYGANMLTKYLAEVGEGTPLTAATCIDNPFDLEEVTRSSPHHIALDQKLAGGLVDILRSNKELFQGRANAFDVEKALMATSVRDFEKAISMVSYGFEAIEELYSKFSTRGVVGNVKIPVLFIQNDDETVPLSSIPCGLIAENPFTSLLLCSRSSSSTIASARAAVSWCQNLTIEWLTSVELGLLKGRHPLLKDVDVTINPSNSLGFVEGRASGKGGKVKKLLDLTESNVVNGYSIDPIKKMLEDSDAATSIHLRSRRGSPKNMELANKEFQGLDNGTMPQTSSVETELIQEDQTNVEDSERGQVLQTAQVIMNMLDITMPGTLKEEEKKKVLAAVDQGETVMKALQDAVPEDVRERLTTAMSGILHAQGTNLNFDRLLDIGRISNLSSGFRSKTQEQVRGQSSAEGLYKEPHSPDQIKRSEDFVDDSIQSGMDKPAGGLGSELHLSENSLKSGDQSQLMSSHQGDNTSSARKGSNESGINHENDDFIKEKTTRSSDSNEKGSETGIEPSITSQEKTGGTEESIGGDYRVDQDVGVARLETKEENVQKNEEKTLDSSTNQNKMASTIMAEEAVSPSATPSECQQIEREGSDNQKKENKNSAPVPDQNKPTLSDSNPPSFSVFQALDALAGIDDSTQVAVNSVFGVIENMISQFKEEKDGENEVKDENIDSVSDKQHTICNHTLEKKEENENDQSDRLHDPCVYNCHQNSLDSYHDAKTGWVEKPTQDSISFNGNGADGSWGNNRTNKLGMERKKKDQLVGSKLLPDYSDRKVNNILPCITANPFGNSLYYEYFRGYLLSKLPTTKPLDLDTTTDLFLDYYPEEGQWMLLEQPVSIDDSISDATTSKVASAKANDTDYFIEPPYVILDAERHQDLIREYETMDNGSKIVEKDDRSQECMHFVKVIILDSLKVEVDRRLSASDMKEMESQLARDLEKVANAVSFSVGHDEGHTWCFEGKNCIIYCTTEKVGTLQGDSIIRAISSVAQRTMYLRRVLPVGVIVGSSLAALRKYFHVSTVHDNGQRDVMAIDNSKKSGGQDHKTSVSGSLDKTDQNDCLNSPISREGVEARLKNINNDGVVVGAVTAALGASALLLQQQDPQKGKEITESLSKPFKEKGYLHKEPEKLDEAISKKNQANIVTSLAEKALSVAGPVVPTKEDGEVDQERLVAMLAVLGQKGGILRLVGKIALLWGGIRGAMSLTERLISFLHIAERPLFQRVLGFVSLVLVLWSPVVVPLLPALVQRWTTRNPSRMAELVCMIGLYPAVMILVMLWGKRIHGYENSLEQYGLDFTSSPKIQDLLKGLIGGIMVVLLIQSVNALIGCVSFSWPSSLPSLDAMTMLKVYGRMLMLAGQGIITATGVVLVEELVFRAWLPEEIAIDLGYHRGIIISGLAFSLFQRSLRAIPGLWLLSLALSGARQRSKGSLSISIGLRTGIMASSFILQTGGFLTYRPNFPLWVSGTHSFEPFSGVVGFAFSLLLAIILYPRPHQERKNLRTDSSGINRKLLGYQEKVLKNVFCRIFGNCLAILNGV